MIEDARLVYKRLAAAKPAQFEPDLAGVLSDTAAILQNLGRLEHALAAVGQAVQLYRDLAARNPRFGQNLAGCLNDMGTILRSLGRLDDALDAAKDAAGAYRQLAADDPRYQKDLAHMLPQLSSILGDLGRLEEQEATAAELKEIQQRFPIDEESSPSLVPPEQIRAVTQEATVAYRRLAADDPRYEGDLASTLQNLLTILSAIGRQDEALAAAEEAVAVWRRLAADDPRYEGGLSNTLQKLSTILSGMERQDEALAAVEEAAAACRRLAANDPRYEGDLSNTLQKLSTILSGIGRQDEALAAVEEAAAACRRLATAYQGLAANDPRYEGDLSQYAAEPVRHSVGHRTAGRGTGRGRGGRGRLAADGGDRPAWRPSLPGCVGLPVEPRARSRTAEGGRGRPRGGRASRSAASHSQSLHRRTYAGPVAQPPRLDALGSAALAGSPAGVGRGRVYVPAVGRRQPGTIRTGPGQSPGQCGAHPVEFGAAGERGGPDAKSRRALPAVGNQRKVRTVFGLSPAIPRGNAVEPGRATGGRARCGRGGRGDLPRASCHRRPVQTAASRHTAKIVDCSAGSGAPRGVIGCRRTDRKIPPQRREGPNAAEPDCIHCSAARQGRRQRPGPTSFRRTATGKQGLRLLLGAPDPRPRVLHSERCR